MSERGELEQGSPAQVDTRKPAALPTKPSGPSADTPKPIALPSCYAPLVANPLRDAFGGGYAEMTRCLICLKVA